MTARSTRKRPASGDSAGRNGSGRRRPPDAERLGRDHWLDAAHAAVVEGGFDAVRVLSIADSLGITRGSFYWHFADHADLVAALVERWRQRELAADRALAEPAHDDPAEDLLHLLDAALARRGEDLREMRFELALRALGRQDGQVARMLAEVDATRVALFTAKFLRLTGDERRATDLAVLFYMAIAGAYQALARPGTGDAIAAYLRDVIAEYLVHRQSPARRGGRGRAVS